MSLCENVVLLGGRLARDVAGKMDGKTPYLRMTIAVDKRMSAQNKAQAQAEGKATADFPEVVVFGPPAKRTGDFLTKCEGISVQGNQYGGISYTGTKGTQVLVRAHINTSVSTGADGKPIYRQDVVVDNISFADLRSANSAQTPQQQVPAQQAAPQQMAPQRQAPQYQAAPAPQYQQPMAPPPPFDGPSDEDIPF